MSKNILIISTLPPPIGGVSIHTQRLLLFLKKNNFKYSFYDYKKSSLTNGFKLFLKAKMIHIHASNQIFIFLVSLFSFILCKKIIITVHGEYNCRGWFLNFLESLSLVISSAPILLNEIDYKRVQNLNKKSLIITSFIPPMDQQDLSLDIINKIIDLRKLTKSIFCTNAYRYCFDFNGNEVYGIKKLINFFNNNIDFGFVLSDPSGEYNSYINSNNIKLNSNIIIISNNHSFFKVLELSDCFIRNTTTDGDSISIREALFLNKKTFATDCVQRPNGVNILTNLSLLTEDYSNYNLITNNIQPNGAEDLLMLYNTL